jgi:hypothetical protein
MRPFSSAQPASKPRGVSVAVPSDDVETLKKQVESLRVALNRVSQQYAASQDENQRLKRA